MAEITQTILYTPEGEAQGIYGNCLQAAVASLLDLPLDAVPHFALFENWPWVMSIWARDRGLEVRGEVTETVPDRRCIVGGKSERGVSHVCIGEHGRIVWDPHPSRAGLVSIRDVTWFEPIEEAKDE